MSEYQYYEFQAVDRPLTPSEMAELRGLSSRASITPTRLQNTYNYGDFRGDPIDLVERYFDAFVYIANWGTHQLMLRLPRRLLDLERAERYASDGALEVFERGDWVIVDFTSRDEDGGGWVEDEEAAGWLPSLIGLRAELADGDLRALYLGWLAGVYGDIRDDEGEGDEDDELDEDDVENDELDEAEVEDDEFDEHEVEPPVPSGLGALSASLDALVDFLELDRDLLHVAAAVSGELPRAPSSAELERWIAALPVAEKDELLARLVTNEDRSVRAELFHRFRQATAPLADAEPGQRTVAELLAGAEERATVRRQAEEVARAAAEARRKQAEAAARERRLDSLAGRDEELWRQVDALVAIKRAKEYDEALALLTDLRDLSVRAQRVGAFTGRIQTLRDRCARQTSLIERLDRAGFSH